jgi:hypothetical protein
MLNGRDARRVSQMAGQGTIDHALWPEIGLSFLVARRAGIEHTLRDHS